MKKLIIILFIFIPYLAISQTLPINRGSYANDPAGDNFRTVSLKINNSWEDHRDSLVAIFDSLSAHWAIIEDIRDDSLTSIRNTTDQNYGFISSLNDSIIALRSDIGSGGSGDFSYSDTTSGPLITDYQLDTAKINIRSSIKTYTEGWGIDITDEEISFANSINQEGNLAINTGSGEHFSVNNTYGFPPNETRFRLAQDSIFLKVNNQVASDRTFTLLMTDTDLDILYDDTDVYTGGGGIQIDTNKVVISFEGTGSPASNSRFYLQQDSAFISSFNPVYLTTQRVATSDYGIFLVADSVFLPELAGSENAWLYITPTGKVDTGTLVVADKMLTEPMPKFGRWLKDKKDGEIKWPYLENGEVVWKYGIQDVTSFQYNVQGAIEILIRKAHKNEIHSWINSVAILLLYVFFIVLFIYIIRTYLRY